MENLTPDQIKEKMLKTPIPWYITLAGKIWFKAGKYIVVGVILLIIILSFIYNFNLNDLNYRTADQMWRIMKVLFFTDICIVAIMFISHKLKHRYIKKQANKLGISVEMWNNYAKDIDLMSI